MTFPPGDCVGIVRVMAQRVTAPSGKALYRVLPPGGRGMTAEQIAFHQRSRLQGAMVVAVAENGYAATTVKQLVSLAGVSRSTFYKLFADKEQCFLSTYDLIAAVASERISRAYREQEDWREQLRAAFECFGRILTEERDASHLVLIALDAPPTARRAAEQPVGALRAAKQRLRVVEGPAHLPEGRVSALDTHSQPLL
jgi:AcrR family transcriptional regulator